MVAGVLHSFAGLPPSPVVAAAMSLSSLGVVSNALRLRGANLDGQWARTGAGHERKSSMRGQHRE